MCCSSLLTAASPPSATASTSPDSSTCSMSSSPFTRRPPPLPYRHLSPTFSRPCTPILECRRPSLRSRMAKPFTALTLVQCARRRAPSLRALSRSSGVPAAAREAASVTIRSCPLSLHGGSFVRDLLRSLASRRRLVSRRQAHHSQREEPCLLPRHVHHRVPSYGES